MSDYIHRLIHSMSPQEKRSFRLSTTLYKVEGKRYTTLFDAINAMESYDEEILRQNFRHRHLAQHKQKLIVKVLQCLREITAETDDRADVLHRLIEAEILHRRNCPKQAFNHFLKSEQTAIETDQTALELLLMQTKTNLFTRAGTYAELSDVFAKYEQQVDRLTARLRQEMLLEKEYLLISLRNKEMEVVRSHHEFIRLKSEVNIALLRPDQFSSSNAALHGFYILGVFKYFSGALVESFEYFRQLVNVFEKIEKLKTLQKPEYSRAVANLALVSCLTANFDTAEQMIRLLQSVYEASDHDSILDYRLVLLKTKLLVCKQDFVGAEEIIEVNRDVIHTVESEKNPAVYQSSEYHLFLLDRIWLLMVRYQFKACSRLIHKYLRAGQGETKTDTHIQIRILLCWCEVEEGSLDGFESQARSLKRWMNIKNKNYRFEKNVLKHLDQLLRCADKKERMNRLTAMHNYIEKAKQQEYDKNALLFFDWAVFIDRLMKR